MSMTASMCKQNQFLPRGCPWYWYTWCGGMPCGTIGDRWGELNPWGYGCPSITKTRVKWWQALHFTWWLIRTVWSTGHLRAESWSPWRRHSSRCIRHIGSNELKYMLIKLKSALHINKWEGYGHSSLPDGSCKACQVAVQEQDPCREHTEHICTDNCMDSFEVRYSGIYLHHSQKIDGTDVYKTCCRVAMWDQQSQVWPAFLWQMVGQKPRSASTERLVDAAS